MKFAALCPFPDDTLRHMSATMGVPRTTLHAWIHSGLVLLESAVKSLIAWPCLKQCVINSSEFLGVCDINGVVGAVDCSHVAILPRESERIAYTNRKSFYSIHLLAVVDARGRFIFVDIGCAGSMADTTVLCTSKLATSQTVRARQSKLPPIPYGYFLLADVGFASLPWVVQNYSTLHCTDSAACQKFNNCIGRGRGIVERAYGQLKMRFKRLGGRSSHDRKEQVARMVRVCCGLHNLNIDMEAELFGALRVRFKGQVVAPLPEVVRLQHLHTAPTVGARLGADQAVREAAYAVRREVANSTLERRGYTLQVKY